MTHDGRSAMKEDLNWLHANLHAQSIWKVAESLLRLLLLIVQSVCFAAFLEKLQHRVARFFFF